MTQANEYGYTPVIDTGVYSVSERALFRPLDQETRAEYREAATQFAERHQPPFLGLGTEVNIHAEDQPAEFETYVRLVEETITEVKAVSPDTSVYVSFQLEWLMGLHGGLFGGTNDPSQAQWDLLDQFPTTDLVGITTYPGLIYSDPGAIPTDHYTTLSDRIDKPIAIVETGWPHTGVNEDWASTETEQTAFIQRLDELTTSLDLALLIWLFVYTQAEVNPPFETMSLRREDGSPRPAWDAWTARSS